LPGVADLDAHDGACPAQRIKIAGGGATVAGVLVDPHRVLAPIRRWVVPLQMFLLGVICVLIAAASDAVWAVLAGTGRSWFGRSPRRLRAVGAGAGAVMVGLGVRLAFVGRPD
jgi:threonine/homoserine/homoserine lactone efflux protein